MILCRPEIETSRPLFTIAVPCVAEQLGEFARRLDLLLIFEKVRSETIVPVLTDEHEPAQDAPVAEVVVVLRTSAFLAGQTDFIAAVAGAGELGNIKKAESIALRPFRQFAGECYGHLSCAASTGI